MATESEIRLEPATVHAGDVWLVIDAPEGSFVFVGASSPGGHEGDSLTDEDLARLMEGDTQYFSFSGFGVGGCSAQQAADDRGKMGPCGNVMQFAVVAGKYALIRDSDQPVPMAVLEVLP